MWGVEPPPELRTSGAPTRSKAATWLRHVLQAAAHAPKRRSPGPSKGVAYGKLSEDEVWVTCWMSERRPTTPRRRGRRRRPADCCGQSVSIPTIMATTATTTLKRITNPFRCPIAPLSKELEAGGSSSWRERTMLFWRICFLDVASSRPFGYCSPRIPSRL